MYFYKQNGEQCLDLTGDFILTHNDNLVMARVSSAAPRGGVKHAKYVEVRKLNFRGKVVALIRVARFIFGKPPALKEAVADIRST